MESRYVEITHSTVIQIITDDQNASDTLLRRCVVRRDDDKFMFRRLTFGTRTKRLRKWFKRRRRRILAKSSRIHYYLISLWRKIFDDYLNFAVAQHPRHLLLWMKSLVQLHLEKTIERIKNASANVNGDYRLVETWFRIKIWAICRSIELVVE